MAFPALEAPRLEMNNFIKRSNRKSIGFRGAAQIGFHVTPDDAQLPAQWKCLKCKKT